MNILFIVLAVLIIILIMLITIDINISFDILNNKGTIKIKFFRFITVFKSELKIIGDYINLTRKKNPIKIKIDFEDLHYKFFQDFIKYSKNKIIPTKIEFDLELCLENAHIISIISGILNIVIGTYLMVLRLNNNDITIKNNIVTGYRHNILILNFKYRFVIAVYDLIWSLIRTRFIIRRYNEKPRKTTRKQKNNHRFNNK